MPQSLAIRWLSSFEIGAQNEIDYVFAKVFDHSQFGIRINQTAERIKKCRFKKKFSKKNILIKKLPMDRSNKLLLD